MSQEHVVATPVLLLSFWDGGFSEVIGWKWVVPTDHYQLETLKKRFGHLPKFNRLIDSEPSRNFVSVPFKHNSRIICKIVNNFVTEPTAVLIL